MSRNINNAPTPIRCRVCDALVPYSFHSLAIPFGRCEQCRALLRMLSAEQYSQLSISYDSGPPVSSVDSRLLRAYLRVDENKHILTRALVHRDKSNEGNPQRRRSFLDIGCGSGGMLLAARELGLEARGLEPSQAHSRIAREVLGFGIVTGHFAADLFPNMRFDMVMLNHVIEHIYYPRPFLEEIAKIVSPNGLLVIQTPNADCVASVATKSSWPMLKTPDHVTLLTPDSIQFLASSETWSVDVESDESHWETPAAILAACRDASRNIAERLFTHGRGENDTDKAVSLQIQWNPSLKYVRGILSLLGVPIRYWARSSGRASNVLAYLRRR